MHVVFQCEVDSETDTGNHKFSHHAHIGAYKKLVLNKILFPIQLGDIDSRGRF